MNIEYVLMWHLEESITRKWSLDEVLEEVNRDRSDGWTNYTEEDWFDGWNEWCEGEFYKLLEIKYESQTVKNTGGEE